MSRSRRYKATRHPVSGLPVMTAVERPARRVTAAEIARLNAALSLLRGMPTRLVREAKAAAARRGTTLAAFVSDAIERSLRGDAGRPEAGGELRDSVRWYEKHRTRLLSLYPGEYIAVVDRRVLDHGRDFGALAVRVFEKLGARPIFMPRVQEGKARRRVRSPRVRG